MPKTVNLLPANVLKTALSIGTHNDGGGLFLQVKSQEARSWLFRYRLQGTRRDMGLGSAGPGHITLAQARELADEARNLIRQGVDPLAARRQTAAAATKTFRVVAEEYIAAKSAEWRNAKHVEQWKMTLTVHAEPLAKKPVNEITTEDILKFLRPLWESRPETASRLRGRIEVVLDSARAQGLREGENPARWRGHLALMLPKRHRLTRGHHSALPYERMSAFMADLRGRNAVAAKALEFGILTAARTGEIIGATWSEIDLAKAIWTIPAKRMKAGKEHSVPLSKAALTVLESVRPLGSKFLFPSQRAGKSTFGLVGVVPSKPLSNMAMLALLHRMDRHDITVHGFRSTFRDWAGETTNFPRELAERALAHEIENKAEAAYSRGVAVEKRRLMMEAWADYIVANQAAKYRPES